MDRHEFIFRIREIVRDAAISSTLTVINEPPGRKPSPELIEAANWYRSLDADQRRILAGVIARAVDSAVFGFLCVLDGVRAIEDHNVDNHHFELRYVGMNTTSLNSPDDEMLHDIYNER